MGGPPFGRTQIILVEVLMATMKGCPPFMVSLPTPLQAHIDIGTMSIHQEMVMTCVSCLDHSNKVKATIGDEIHCGDRVGSTCSQ